MSVTQVYSLAHTARAKLWTEASRADHNLRLLIGHANVLDSLMLELAESEQEQEPYLNRPDRQASRPTEQKHIQWAHVVVEDPEEDWQAEDADSSDSSSSDSDDYSDYLHSRPVPISYDGEIEDDGTEDYENLTLTLESHGASPPDLEHDSGDLSTRPRRPHLHPSTCFPSHPPPRSSASRSPPLASTIR